MNRAINLGPAALGGALGAGQIILPEDDTKFLNGEGEWAVPSGVGGGSSSGSAGDLQFSDGAGGFDSTSALNADNIYGLLTLTGGAGSLPPLFISPDSVTGYYMAFDGVLDLIHPQIGSSQIGDINGNWNGNRLKIDDVGQTCSLGASGGNGNNTLLTIDDANQRIVLDCAKPVLATSNATGGYFYLWNAGTNTYWTARLDGSGNWQTVDTTSSSLP